MKFLTDGLIWLAIYLFVRIIGTEAGFWVDEQNRKRTNE